MYLDRAGEVAVLLRFLDELVGELVHSAACLHLCLPFLLPPSSCESTRSVEDIFENLLEQFGKMGLVLEVVLVEFGNLVGFLHPPLHVTARAQLQPYITKTVVFARLHRGSSVVRCMRELHMEHDVGVLGRAPRAMRRRGLRIVRVVGDIHSKQPLGNPGGVENLWADINRA